jgi:molybdate transport system substrate-binding protein
MWCAENQLQYLVSRYFIKVLICVFGGLNSQSHAQSISVAAAANLNGVLDAIVQQYTKQSGITVKVIYGSSGHFYQQITQGAKFDIFLSANEEFVDRLVTQRVASGSGVMYARGRLVLLVSQKSKIRPSADMQDIKQAIRDGRLTKFAIANPALAPYGLAAKQVLEQIGLTQLLQPRLVLGGDVGQTMLFIKSEAAQAGMVPWSMIKTSPNIKEDEFFLIPEKSHQPILQKMLLFKDANSQARLFYEHLQTEKTRTIWRQYGYE